MTKTSDPIETHQHDELMKKRKRRSKALALILALLVVLFYTMTFIKGPGLLDRSFY